MPPFSPTDVPDPSPWLPDAWLEPSTPDLGPGADDSFVVGWGMPVEPLPGRGAASSSALDALLPDFGGMGRGRDGDRGFAAVAAAAADAREAAVRAELEAAFVAELEARDAAHMDALTQAWTEGHAAGAAAGEEAARAAFADAAGALDAAVAEVQAHEERWMGDLHAHIAALAVAVAHHVVGREVATDDTLVVALTARAIAEFPMQEPLVARVHPDDLDALKAAWDGSSRDGALRWAPDSRVARGGALVEGRERIVDGRVDAALERLYRALAGHVA